VPTLPGLKGGKLKIDHWQNKESTRDAVRVEIQNFLWGDQTGLPVECYTDEDVTISTEKIFHHIYQAYPRVPSPVYATPDSIN